MRACRSKAALQALQRARIDLSGFSKLKQSGLATNLHFYVNTADEFDLRTRMFAPLSGIAEDPATGSANCALAALLTHLGQSESSGGSWRIAQGVEMGRPSVLQARALRERNRIQAWIGGNSVMVAEGFPDLD